MEPERVKPLIRSGVRYNCLECGLLLKDDTDHEIRMDGACLSCDGDLRVVALAANSLVGDARWLRCLSCERLHMFRRRELVKTTERSGSEFTLFDSDTPR